MLQAEAPSAHPHRAHNGRSYKQLVMSSRGHNHSKYLTWLRAHWNFPLKRMLMNVWQVMSHLMHLHYHCFYIFYWQVIAATIITHFCGLPETYGVNVVGEIPSGWVCLWACKVSVGQTRQTSQFGTAGSAVLLRIKSNQETGTMCDFNTFY